MRIIRPGLATTIVVRAISPSRLAVAPRRSIHGQEAMYSASPWSGTSDPAVPVWGIAAPGTDNISSPATHGATPTGAIQTFAVETTLTSGVQYRVTVAKIAGSDFGFTDFTP